MLSLSKNQKISLLLVLVLVSVFFSILGQPILATGIGPDNENQTVNIEQDLGVSHPRILPGHFLYRAKEFWRDLREFFAFNPVAKLELKEKFASERLLELKKLTEKDASSTIVQQAIDNYNQEMQELRDKVMKLKTKAQDDSRVDAFLDKFLHQQTLHYQVLEKLQTQVPPEALEKIKAQREKHLERFQEVMLKLEEKDKITQRLEKALDRLKDESTKELEKLEFLRKLEPRMPRETREKVTELKQKVVEQIQSKISQSCPRGQAFPPGIACAQMIVYAKNPDNNECCFYSTPCDAPRGWSQFASLEECQEERVSE